MIYYQMQRERCLGQGEAGPGEVREVLHHLQAEHCSTGWTLQCGTCRPGAGARNCVFWSEMGLVVETLDRLRGLAASVKPDMTATWILVDSSIIPEFLFSKLPF